MICKKCGRPHAIVIEGKAREPIFCPHCAIEKSHDALRQYQIQFLPLMTAGKDEFVLHSKSDGLHVQMFGRNTFKAKNKSWRAFCGAIANAGPDKRRRLAYQAPGWQHVCEKCRGVIEELLAEAREQEAIRAQ